MTVTIDAGIGTIRAISDNLKLHMLLESLKEKIESGGLDKIILFLTDLVSLKDLPDKVKELENDIINLTVDNESQKTQIEELEGLVAINGDSEIDCGIGVVNYYEPDNIALQDLMENLEAAIKRSTPGKVNKVLEEL